jgi:Na+/phosphate symporter
MSRWVALAVAFIGVSAGVWGPRGLLLIWAGVSTVLAVRVITGRDPWSLRPGSSAAARRNGLASVLMVVTGGLIVVLILLPFSMPLYVALAGVCALAVGLVAYLGRRIGRTSAGASAA